MKIDQLGLVITSEPAPGCYGDAMAETSRNVILRRCVSKTDENDSQLATENHSQLDRLLKFRTNVGFLRHPLSPWAEFDTSSDQLLPWLIAMQLIDSPIRAHWYRIPGTRTIVSPGVWCAVRGHWRLLSVINMVQGLIMKFPYRWSDDGRLDGKLWKFVRSDGHTADYLNFACTYVALKHMGIRSSLLHERIDVIKKISDYYRPQEGFAWVVADYFLALTK